VSGADAWDRIWAPHRKEYLVSEAGQFTDDTCPFCRARDVDNETGLVVVRGQWSYVVMNKYPYAAGHIMVCSNRHVPLYDQLDDDERSEIAALTQQAMRVLRAVSGCAGFNIGMNQGGVAGAGVADHLHQHVVPRWAGDSNFMPIVAGTRVMPELIEATREALSESWSQHAR
jgi:ATP adenylyltransferase